MKNIFRKIFGNGADDQSQSAEGRQPRRFRDLVASGFPSSIEFPDELAALCDWHEKSGLSSIGDFELRADDGESIYWWFRSHDADERLAQFGAGPSGSLYCIWLQQDGRQPIVHLGSEGDNLKVLAGTMREFIILLAIGYDEFELGDFSEPPSNPDAVDHGFRSWVEESFACVIPDTGFDIAYRAAVDFDDFESFVNSIEED